MVETIHSLRRPIQQVVHQMIFVLMIITVAGITFSVAVSSIAMALAIVAFGFLMLTSSTRTFPKTGLEIVFLFYIVAEVLATIFSVEPASSLINVKRLILISVLYLVLLTVDSEKRLKSSIGILATTAAAVSLIEIFSITSIGGHFARVSLFQYFLTEGGIKMMLLLLLLPLLLHHATPRSWKVFVILCDIPLLIGLILTQTRSSWLGFIAGTLFIGVLKSKKVILVLIVIILIFLLAAPVDFRSRAASIFDPTFTSNLTRIHMITTGWRMFLDRPVFGWGDIDLKKYYLTYTTPIDDAEGGHLHNNMMMILVTLGIIGFVAVIALFVKIYLLEYTAVRLTTDHWLFGSISLGALAAYVGFHVNGLFEWNFGDHEIAVLLWFTIGVGLASHRLLHYGKEIVAA